MRGSWDGAARKRLTQATAAGTTLNEEELASYKLMRAHAQCEAGVSLLHVACCMLRRAWYMQNEERIVVFLDCALGTLAGAVQHTVHLSS